MTTMHVKPEEVEKTKERHLKNLTEFMKDHNAKANSPREQAKIKIKKYIFKALDGCCYNLSKEILEEVIHEIGYKAYVESEGNDD